MMKSNTYQKVKTFVIYTENILEHVTDDEAMLYTYTVNFLRENEEDDISFEVAHENKKDLSISVYGMTALNYLVNQDGMGIRLLNYPLPILQFMDENALNTKNEPAGKTIVKCLKVELQLLKKSDTLKYSHLGLLERK